MSDTIIPDATLDVSESAEPTENTEAGEETEGIEASGDTSTEGDAAATEKKAPNKLDKIIKAEEKKVSNKKKFKIKVDGKEEDYEFDPDNEEELKKTVQLSRAAQKRMAEMADMKKDVSELIHRLQQDPLSFLADKENGLGMDTEDLVRKYVEQRLADAQKSPEQLKAEATERELARMKAERENEKTERERERYEAALQNEVVKYDTMMAQALENSEFKKPSPYLVKKMSDYLILGVQNGIDVTPQDILPLVRDEIQNEIRELINSAPEEVIEAMFGKEIFNKLRKKHVAKAKQAPVHASSIKDTGNKDTKPLKEEEKQSYKSFFKF